MQKCHLADSAPVSRYNLVTGPGLLLLLAVFMVFLGGCNTPVIPIPPPPIETLQLEIVDPGKNEISINGRANSNLIGMLVFLYNQRTGDGVINTAEADGSFVTDPLPVQDRDRLDLWAAIEAEDPSDSLCLEVDLSQGALRACE